MTKNDTTQDWRFDETLAGETAVIGSLDAWVAPGEGVIDAMVVDRESGEVLWLDRYATVGGAKRAARATARRLQALHDQPPGRPVMKWHPDADVYGEAAAYLDVDRVLDLVVTPSASGIVEADVVEADVLWRGHYLSVGAAKRAAIAAAKRIVQKAA